VSILEIRLNLWSKPLLFFFLPMKMKLKFENYWVSGFLGYGSSFTQNPLFFMGFSFFKTISTQSPNPTHFFRFFLLGLTGFWVYPTHAHPYVLVRQIARGWFVVCCILASNWEFWKTLKSCHDSGHRDTIGLAERLVLEMENRDAIQQLPHQVYLKGTSHDGCSETSVARLVKIVTRFWTCVTSI